MRTDLHERKDDILTWISEDKPKAWICRQFGCKPDTLDRALKDFGVVYKGNQGGRGKTSNKKKTVLEYIESTCVKSHYLKLKILDEKVKDHICEKCKNTHWLGFIIPLELHHKDGNHYNNKLENLELLCPTCHALEPNNSGKASKHI